MGLVVADRDAVTSQLSRRYLLGALAVFALAGVVLLAMGRVPICKCGYIV